MPEGVVLVDGFAGVMARRVLHVTVHGIGEHPDPTSTERWNWLEANHLGAVLDVVRERSHIRLMVDDCYASDVEVVLPGLLDRGLRATFFPVAGRVGRRHFVTPHGLRELSAAGMTIGCQGMDHRPWRGLEASQLEVELVAARANLEDIVGQPVTEAACPFGSYDRQVLRALRRASYRAVFTSDGGWANSNAWLQPRNTLARDGGSTAIARLRSGRTPERRKVLRPVKTAIKRWR